MLKFLKRSFTMNTKIFALSASILLTCLLITGIFVHNHFRQLYAESLDNAIQVIMENHASSIEDCFQRTETIGNLLNADLPLLIPQLKESTDSFEKYWAYLDLEAKLESFCDSALGQDINYRCYLLLHSEFPTASLLSPAGENLFDLRLNVTNTNTKILQDRSYKKQEWFQMTTELDGSAYWFSHPDTDHYIWMTRSLNDYFNVKGKVEYYSLGMLVIGIDISWITEYFDDSTLINNLNFFITDPQHRIIYAENPELLNRNFSDLTEEKGLFPSQTDTDLTFTMNGTNYRLWVHTLSDETHLLSFIPEQTFKSQLRDSLYLFLMLFIVVLIAGMLLTALFARIVTAPVRTLSAHMKNISKPTPISHNYEALDEMGVLYNTFNEMTEKHNQLIQQIYDYAEQQKQLKYKFLQAQINPHFLYNTLDSVGCVALLHGEARLSDTLSSLAHLLRYNINDPEKLVTLKDELDMVNDYINIQQFRCDDHIRFICTLPEKDRDILLAKIPKTILQPLVENSIQYGSVNEDGCRYISIYVTQSEDAQDVPVQSKSIVSVIICNEYNNTECTPESIINLLNDYLAGKCELKRKNSGLGIINIQQRIHFLFGDAYGIHYELIKDNVAAVIRIPFFN